MKKVTYFYLPGCPYCRQADEVLAELLKEHPEYKAVEIYKISETEHPEIANQYDYYYNPAMFIGKEKVYEAHPGETRQEARTHVLAVLKKAYGV